MVRIPGKEFSARVSRLQALMKGRKLDACLVYGDEYRRENLRYVCNYWPIFERGAMAVAADGGPIILAAPEGEKVCAEMSAFPDIRLVPDFACVTVPDAIEYPLAKYTDFASVFQELSAKRPIRALGIVGVDAMPAPVLDAVAKASGARVEDAGDLLFEMRRTKSVAEVECLRQAAAIADEGYRALMAAAKPGAKESDLEAEALRAAKKRGAESVPFCLVSSGPRVNAIIGRSTQRVLNDGDMVMAALAVQYEGYIATLNFPFVAGRMSGGQRAFIDILVKGEEIALSHLKAGACQGTLVKAVKEHFGKCGVSAYDIYPPLHGCGMAEAESPYPDGRTSAAFEEGMTVNIDLSLFGHPDGSNRIEESLLVTKGGSQPLSGLAAELREKWRSV
jgi:Xaa-Pro aminopeptidase